jgi:hypothetical protein
MIEMTAAFLLAAGSYAFVEQSFLARRYAAAAPGKPLCEFQS